MEIVNSTETKKFIQEEMAITKPYLEKVPFRAELTARYKELYAYPTITRLAQQGNKFISYETNGSPSQKQKYLLTYSS
jgi:prolyl oligopeptidase PreP (S9A serine peptidase family)